MVKKLLVNGCSFSRGPGSWPYHVAKGLNADICNLAQSGAGNTYIRQSTIVELSQRTYDLVLIMWSGPERVDVQVEEINLFDTSYTSKYQSLQNDWPEKIIYPINDQDYVEKNWVFGCGYVNADPFLRKNDLFRGLYKYIGHNENVKRSLIDMICLQDILRARNINYAFCFYQNYCINNLRDQKNLWNLIDHSKIIVGDLGTMSHDLDSFDKDGLHPGIEAHRRWAQHVLHYLDKKNDNFA